MTRTIPAEAGTGMQVGTCSDGTRGVRQNGVTGTVVRLTPDHEQVAAEIVERVGPLAAARIAVELIAALTQEVGS